MNLSDAKEILRDLRKKPVKTLGLVLLILIAVLVVRFLLTYSGEKAQQIASQDELPTLEEALRITYTRVESAELLSRFVQGIAYSADASFDARPFIVNNNVYRDLERLLNLLPDSESHSAYKEVEVHTVHGGGQKVDSWTLEDLRVYSADGRLRVRDGKHHEQERYMRLLSEIRSIRPPTSTHSHNPNELLRRVKDDPFWVIDYVDMSQWMHGVGPKTSELYSFFFVGIPTNKELRDVAADPITQRVAEENPTRRDLAIQKVYFQHAGYLGHVAVRELSLLSLDIENISTSPVELDTLKVHALESGLFSLATEEELVKSFAKTEFQAYKPPVAKLLPGEHLLVPLRIALGISRAPGRSQWYHDEKVIDESTFPENPTWWRNRPGFEVSIPIARGFSSTGDLEAGQAAVRRLTLEGKEDLRKEFVDLYYLASAIHVTEVAGRLGTSASETVSVREYDPTNVVFRGSDEVGSCPILYVEVLGFWERLGPVFPFAVGRNSATNFAVRLPVGTNRIKFVEEERERSFIDGVWLTSQPKLWAGDSEAYGNELLPVDGHFTMLSPGDELVIALPAPAPTGTRLIVRGYYLPLAE